MAEEPQPMSIQARIAALNHAQLARIPGDNDHHMSRMKPAAPPTRPDLAPRVKSTNIPVAEINGSVANISIGNEPSGARQNGYLPPPVITRTGQKIIEKPKPQPPPLPKRQPTLPSPALPPRRPSQPSPPRRGSSESTNSAISSTSTWSTGTTKTSTSRSPSTDAGTRLRAPAWGDTTLPPLPPKRENTEKGRPPLKPRKSVPNMVSQPTQETKVPSLPSLPPRLPPRKDSTDHSTPNQPPHSLPSPGAISRPKPSALSFGMNKEEVVPISKELPNVAAHGNESHNNAPPIPMSSRPDLSKLQSTKPRLSPTSSQDNTLTICLKCRDFSAVDAHASHFPRQTLPTEDLNWLAQQLAKPFLSLTDKARAIFTWLHHNINYDVDAFFNNCVQSSTPASTFRTGLAVCEGYAALFTALATYAGLESIVISGHGKGYGHQALPPGAPTPPFSSNHAWNVVKIDNEEWKLLDACWGAGDVSGGGQPYNKNFKPQFFTMTNDEFGLKHYPTNKSHFYRDDGRAVLPWEEYILNDPDKPNGIETLTVFSNVQSDHGVGDHTFLPRGKHISVRDSRSIRFQFALLCPHWTIERTAKGAPYVFILIAHGIDGRKDEYIPFEHVRGRNTGGGGDSWFADVDARQLGAPGQKLTLFAVTNFDGREGRGLSVNEFRSKIGRCAMAFSGVAEWVLV